MNHDESSFLKQLVGGFSPYPSEKWWTSSVGMVVPNIWKKYVPNHQPVCLQWFNQWRVFFFVVWVLKTTGGPLQKFDVWSQCFQFQELSPVCLVRKIHIFVAQIPNYRSSPLLSPFEKTQPHIILLVQYMSHGQYSLYGWWSSHP